MAITTISRMQQRRGVKADLPVQLAEGEFGWCLDTRELFIGNGPGFGQNTAVLTEYSNNSNLITNRYGTFNTTISVSSPRPIGEKLNDIANVKDFGAKGDGITDDSPAINAVIQEMLGRIGPITPTDIALRAVLHFPAGVYLINQPLLLYPFLTLSGDGIGKTIIRASADFATTAMMSTSDNLGQTDASIGLSGATLPLGIVVRDMTIDTNGLKINACHLVRYNDIEFNSVEFAGGYTPGDLTADSHSALRLESIGNAITTRDAQFIDCRFHNFTYAVYSDDPVKQTRLSQCLFDQLYKGIMIGLNYVPSGFNGPSYTVLMNSILKNIDSNAIDVASPNPGVISIGNSFESCGVSLAQHPILWRSGTSLCSSIGDVFDTVLKVSNLGTNNIIANPQVVNINGPTGPTGPIGIQGLSGPTGPTGSGSTFNGANIVVISNTTPSTSTVSGALQLAGGAGIAGNLYVGGNIVTSSAGVPEIVSATNLLLTAGNRVDITTSPLRLASFTTTNRNALTASNADIIYNTTVNRFQGYQNGAWINLDDGSPA